MRPWPRTHAISAEKQTLRCTSAAGLNRYAHRPGPITPRCPADRARPNPLVAPSPGKDAFAQAFRTEVLLDCVRIKRVSSAVPGKLRRRGQAGHLSAGWIRLAESDAQSPRRAPLRGWSRTRMPPLADASHTRYRTFSFSQSRSSALCRV